MKRNNHSNGLNIATEHSSYTLKVRFEGYHIQYLETNEPSYEFLLKLIETIKLIALFYWSLNML